MPSDAGYDLVHPVYLDVPMMISFLAYLEGGVVTSEAQTQTHSDARERVLRARVGLRLRFLGVGDAEGEGEGSRQRRDEATTEATSERHHTEASLFNLLYEYLRADDQLLVLESDDDLGNVTSGQLVQISGQYLGNPLEEVLGFFGSFLPLFVEQQAAERDALAAAVEAAQRQQAARRKGNHPRQVEAAESQAPSEEMIEALTELAAHNQNSLGLHMVLQMAEDIRTAPVHDLLVQTKSGLKAVLTVSSSFFSAETNESLRSGEFRIIGKVTKVITEDMSINLTRRTLLGATGPNMAQDMINMFQGGGDNSIALDVPDPIVKAPSVQILPMAIFL